MNKRGFSNIYFVFLLVIALVFYIAPIHFKINSEPTLKGFIGERASELIASHAEVDKFNIYYDASKDLAQCSADYELGKNGGFIENKCGVKEGYTQWSRNCNPLSSLQQDYTKYLDKEIKKYLLEYAKKIRKKDFNPNFNYKFESDKVIANSLDKLELTLAKGVTYFMDVSFKTKPNLGIYREINKKVEDSISCFSNKDPKECINDNNWEMSKKGNLVFFDIKTGEKCVVKEGDKFLEKEVSVKFARDFTTQDLLATSSDLLSGSK